jgi:hypothetical protein
MAHRFIVFPLTCGEAVPDASPYPLLAFCLSARERGARRTLRSAPTDDLHDGVYNTKLHSKTSTHAFGAATKGRGR